MPSDRVTRAYLELLRRVLVFVRFRSSGNRRLSDEQLFDLMDAMHNVPTLLTGRDPYFTDENIRSALADYDAKWCERSDGGASLISILDEALAH